MLSQHDFGHVDVRFLDATKRRIHFFASRLKYSRWVEVTIVSDECAQTLVRTLAEHWKVGTIADALHVHHDTVRLAITTESAARRALYRPSARPADG